MIFTNETYSTDGTVLEKTVFDTDTQTVTITTAGEDPQERPMTPEESAALDNREQHETEQVNSSQMVAESDESVDKLVAVIEALNALTALTNAQINQNPAAVIKDLAREVKTVARQVNREARLTSGRTESTDTGPILDV
jgi:transcription initiation factor IIF auxiliary subunit